jgi:hypothetical protein
MMVISMQTIITNYWSQISHLLFQNVGYFYVIAPNIYKRKVNNKVSAKQWLGSLSITYISLFI